MSQQDQSPEDWALEKIRAGKIADFHARFGECDPKSSADWNDDRRLSTSFLRRILSDEECLRDIPAEGVRIVGAWFPEELALPDGHLRRQLWLEQCRFEKPVNLCFQTINGSLSFAGSFVVTPPGESPAINLDNARIDKTLFLNGAIVEGMLTMNGLHVGEDLFIRGEEEQPARFAEVDLSNARIDGQLIFEGAVVKGKLTMNGLHVGEDLFVRGGEEQPVRFAELDLSNAEINGRIEIGGAVEGLLTMNGSHVAKDLFIGGQGQPAKLAAIDLTAAEIDGQLRLVDVTVEGVLTMNGLHVSKDLFMRGNKDQPAMFTEIDLANAKIDGQLRLESATVADKLIMNGLQVGEDLIMGSAGQPAKFAAVDLTNAKIDGQLVIEHVTVKGRLEMRGLEIGQHLVMEGKMDQPTKFAAVDLTGAKIDGDLSLHSATVEGTLMMNGVHVGRHLYMGGKKDQPAKFAAVDLSNAKIEGQLNLDGATVKDELKMTDIEVGRDLFMHGDRKLPTTFTTVDLSNAEIDGRLVLDGATFDGTLTMNGLQVGQALFMRGIHSSAADLGVMASLQYLQVGTTLDLRGAKFARLDLSGSKVTSEFRLTAQSWSGDESLILRNTSVSVLHDEEDAWPRHLELDGFTYDRLGGVAERVVDPSRRRNDRPNRWYIDWLDRDPTYSPQPYEQLAEVFRKAGEPAMARGILYAGRERARREARAASSHSERATKLRAGLRYLGMSLLKWTIGYGLGLRYFLCLLWIAVLTGIGMVFLHYDGTAVLEDGATAQLNFGDSLVYSVQQLIPFVEFEKFEQVQLGSLAKWYFYLHKALGYVLAIFLGAGLSGLTQKS